MFTTYLIGPFELVKISSIIHDCFKLNVGVPQGSVLGPLLCSLYTTLINQLITKHMDMKYYFYTDYTQLFIQLFPGHWKLF